MGNVIEVPSIWKFYYNQIQGEYYKSKEDALNQINAEIIATIELKGSYEIEE